MSLLYLAQTKIELFFYFWLGVNTMEHTEYKLKDWVPLDKLGTLICANKRATKYLSEWCDIDGEYLVDCELLSANPGAISILKRHPNLVRIAELCGNTNPDPDIMDFITGLIVELEEDIADCSNCSILHHTNLDFVALCRMPWAVCLIERCMALQGPFYRCLNGLCLNPSPEAVPLIKKYAHHYSKDVLANILCGNDNLMNLVREGIIELEYVFEVGNKNWLSSNYSMAEYLEQNPHLIDWSGMSQNTNPVAVRMLSNNVDKIDWFYASANESAMDLIEQHKDKVCWEMLSANQEIFEPC